ncbi:MAG: outer membrane lipoprotein carrier protein LolA [Gluconacetobacter diazotrophicus]|nr:outer membrane lipoprotein carrier protein LolA [Gluconacetobacter diazotrophicus]
MIRRHLAATLFCAVSALLSACASDGLEQHSPADRAAIARVQDTLDRLRGTEARFDQQGPGAQVASGTAWFQPGELRLAYDQPAGRIVVAANGRLTATDAATGSTTRASLAANPLGLLLAVPVRLSGDIRVTDVQHPPGGLQLSLARTGNPRQGLLTLVFAEQSDGTLLLSALDAVDAEQHRTRFTLSDERTGLLLDPALFIPPG